MSPKYRLANGYSKGHLRPGVHVLQYLDRFPLVSCNSLLPSAFTVLFYHSPEVLTVVTFLHTSPGLALSSPPPLLHPVKAPPFPPPSYPSLSYRDITLQQFRLCGSQEAYIGFLVLFCFAFLSEFLAHSWGEPNSSFQVHRGPRTVGSWVRIWSAASLTWVSMIAAPGKGLRDA